MNDPPVSRQQTVSLPPPSSRAFIPTDASLCYLPFNNTYPVHDKSPSIKRVSITSVAFDRFRVRRWHGFGRNTSRERKREIEWERGREGEGQREYVTTFVIFYCIVFRFYTHTIHAGDNKTLLAFKIKLKEYLTLGFV